MTEPVFFDAALCFRADALALDIRCDTFGLELPEGFRVARTEQNFDGIALSLLQMDSIQLRARPERGAAQFMPILREHTGNYENDIFGCWNKMRELRYVQIEISIRESLQDLGSDQVVEPGNRDDQSSAGVYRPGNSDFQDIIVPVAKRIVALAIETSVLSSAQLPAVEAMR